MAKATPTIEGRDIKPRGAPVTRRVFEVALEHLAEKGFAAFSLPEVAAAAGLHKTSLYRRWPTKIDLIRAALEASMGYDEPPSETGNLRTDMIAHAERALELVQSPLGMSVLRTLLAGSAADELRAIAEGMLQGPATSGPRRLLERAKRRGDLRPDADVRLALSVIAGALLHRLLVEHAHVTRRDLERLVDLVLTGIGSTSMKPARST